MPTIKTLATTDSNAAKARPGSYLWEAPGGHVSVYITLDAVDRLLQDVMRGFGAVPKRGAEVGGILLGRSDKATPLTVEVEDYELVPIEYKRGPSYLLSDGDMKAFEESYGRRRHGFKGGLYPVGMFRSSTRDVVALAKEDLDLMERFFPEDDKVVLMIRPYATKVSTAGFYVREGGEFPEGPPLAEFPFRRRELGGGADAEPPSSGPSRIDRSILRGAPDADAGEPAALVTTAYARPAALPLPELPAPAVPPSLEADTELPALPKPRTWMWLPLSFIFLLLGVLLGYQAAVTLHPPSAPSDDPYNLGLVVTKDGDNLSVRWDRQASAVKASKHGVLVIQDGAFSKTVDLDPSQLQTGSVVYRHSTKAVKFRLEIQIHEHGVMSESFDWAQ
jgi:hypothetical protein